MDNKELLKLKVGIGILAIGIIIFILSIAKIFPDIKRIPTAKKEIQTQNTAYEDAKRQLAELNAEEEKKENEAEDLLKAFFKPEESGLDAEAVMGLEFGEILNDIKENKIKIKSIKYDYDPADDNFIKNVGNKYHACRLDLEMIASYKNLEEFLRDLYKHPHFLEISKIEISPYAKNKRILLTNLQIKIYSQKDAAEQAAYVPPAEAAPTEATTGAKSDNAEANTQDKQAPATTDGKGLEPMKDVPADGLTVPMAGN